VVTVGSILGDTFRFVRANLPSIAVWGAIILLVQMGLVAMRPVYRVHVGAITQGTPFDFFADPDGLIGLLMIAVTVVLYAAVLRAVFSPNNRAAFYLRLGADEARLAGLFFRLGCLCATAMLALSVVLLVIGIVLALILGEGAVGVLTVALAVLLCAGLIFLAVRLSIAAPLTMLGREIDISSAWYLTGGRFWTLFGAYFVLGLGTVMFHLAILWPLAPQMFAAIQQRAGPDAAAGVMALQPDQMWLNPASGHILGQLLLSVSGVIVLVFFGGASAMAALQLIKAHEADG